QEIEIDTEKLSAGAYVLRVIQDGNQWQTKLIIQK
ncbi:MAG: T9SS type A sorting domain-containing protein, partial [Saprospiraceae bacterium]|nr:T9SS type A sorting domain-containing protein [Saprospiraceae bacterium]